MLKLMFTGSAIVGFALAVALGLGYNPSGLNPLGGGSTVSAAAAPTGPVSPKTTLGGDKPVSASQAPATNPIAEAAKAFDPADIAKALESITGGATDTQPAATDSASSTPSMNDLTNMFTELTGIKVDGNSMGGGDFSLDSLLKMLGGGR